MPRSNFGTWSIGSLALYTVSLPLFGFFFCIFFSFIHDFERATYTHCGVPNFTPSISAAIGSFVPQKYVWEACIAVHIGPRFYFSDLYRRYFETKCDYSKNPWVRRVLSFSFFLSVLENLSLLGLSVVSSHELFSFHKLCFGTFIGSSFFYMLITSYLLFNPAFSGFVSQHRNDRLSVTLKKRVFKAQLFLIPLLLYFYYRHNTYCEPYVYSFFCIFEYLIVLTNMAFHTTAYYDFKDTIIMTSTLNSAGYGILPDLSNA